MRFFIVDDDRAVRVMLRTIIEDENIGIVVDEDEDGIEISSERLNRGNIDILLIDLLMPERDGIQTVKKLYPAYKGKVIMISQVETKDLIAEAYSCQVEQYITKPINYFEVLSVLRKVANHIRLESSILEIQKSLQVLGLQGKVTTINNVNETDKLLKQGEAILSELGIRGEAGSSDLLLILKFLDEKKDKFDLYYSFPPLKEIWQSLADIRIEQQAFKGKHTDHSKEMKAAEQRVRRAIQHALNHVASLGTIDYTNPKFEDYASKYLDLSLVHHKMKEMVHNQEPSPLHSRINIKKFLRALYYDAKEQL